MTHAQDPLRVTNERHHLYELLKDFRALMLGTFEQTGSEPCLRARPMHVARIDEDCTLYFITRAPSEKVDEAAATRAAHVFAQSSTQFVSMQGKTRLSSDRVLLKQLWNKAYEVWLTGPDDPHATLIVFKPHEAELWDVSGLKGVRFLFESARALIGDNPPKYGSGMHERVRM